ncbi:MAG: alpha/beta fold hydrolase [Nostocaceae cyanobacterium]|nr:alpha/beta fold hydrolase [Nostocaceae cyanobacterium]
MIPAFLPSQFQQLNTVNAITFAESIQRCAIATPLSQQPIATTFVHQGNSEVPILLIHGFDSSILEFRRLLPLLAEFSETWAVDLLGFGFTERLSGIPYTPSTIKTHLYHFWKTAINRPVTLVGASMGGATAIDFTLTYPHSVKQLILINSVGYTGSFPQGRFLFPPLDDWAVEFWRQRKLQALFLGTTFANLKLEDLESLRCATLHLEMPGWHEAMKSFTTSGGYSDLAPQIQRLSQKTLILWGDSDDEIGTADAEKFQRDIVRSQLVWLKSGHVPQLQQPEMTAAQIKLFTESV